MLLFFALALAKGDIIVEIVTVSMALGDETAQLLEAVVVIAFAIAGHT